MIEAEHPPNEAERLAALLSYGILDTEPEQAYDDLTLVASEICGTPIALVSLIDSQRQWFKSRVGLDATETPRGQAFCAHAILEPDKLLVIPDSGLDQRFHDNPLVVGEPSVRFYAGAPLVDKEGMPLGTLCAIDHEPRELAPRQLECLHALSRQVVGQLELRRNNAALFDLAAEVQRANVELNEFTSHAAHDLREPLRKLTAFGSLLVRDLGEGIDPRVAENLGYILDASQRMDRLVLALLQLSRAGNCELEEDEFDLDDCAHLAIDSLGTSVKELGAQFEFESLPTVRGDMTLLTQVFQNLIGNAMKFTESQPRIRITCRQEGKELVVGVLDNGIGMDPAFADRIFEPFRRLHGRGSSFEGTGIGLSIVRKIVQRHGGRIWAESSPGQGAHFRFTLGCMQASRAKAA